MAGREVEQNRARQPQGARAVGCLLVLDHLGSAQSGHRLHPPCPALTPGAVGEGIAGDRAHLGGMSVPGA